VLEGKEAARERDAMEKTRLNRVKASPEDREDVRAARTPRPALPASPRNSHVQVRLARSWLVKMQILSGWTRQRLSKCDCERERRNGGGPSVAVALRSLSRKNIVLRLEDKQWTPEPFVEREHRFHLLSAVASFSRRWLLAFLAPPTPRSHFLFARQINPPRRGGSPSLSGTSRCPFPPVFFSPPDISRSRAHSGRR